MCHPLRFKVQTKVQIPLKIDGKCIKNTRVEAGKKNWGVLKGSIENPA
jgi:hypothetical protein